MRNSSLLITAIVLSLAATHASAGIAINYTDYSAIASSDYSNRSAANAVNGSGLTDPVGTPGTMHLAPASPDNIAWHTYNSNVQNAWLIIDLGNLHTLDSATVWNYNHPGVMGNTYSELTRGIRTYNLWTRTDSSAGGNTHGSKAAFNSAGWTLSLENASLEPATGLDTYIGQSITLNNIQAQMVAVEVLTNYYGFDVDNDGVNETDPFGNYVGLSEIRFYETPEPATIIYLAIAAVAFAIPKRNHHPN